MTKSDIEEEFRLYKFIIKNDKKARYDSIKQEFGESIWILTRKCIRYNFISEEIDPVDKTQFIKITKSGLRRYRERHYLLFLVFLRSIFRYLRYQTPIIRLNKQSKRHITIVTLTVLTIFVMIWIAYKQGIFD